MSKRSNLYLPCAHCGCEFLASKRQLKRSRSSSYSGSSYCSMICQKAATSAKMTRPPHSGICQHCGKVFSCRYSGKKFCSMRCYTSSDLFKTNQAKAAAKGRAASILARTGKEEQPKIEVECHNCGVKRIYAASKQRKFCSPRCYRKYMAERFDRWVANPQQISLPQCYDEFLTQIELPCLIDGCNWVGKHLGSHVNLAHGIPVEEFKRAAGFNKSTGLVTPEVADKLAARPHIHDAPGDISHLQNAPVIVKRYKSLEGIEHRLKAITLKLSGPSEIPVRVCEGCGKEYQPSPMGHSAKFCSVSCRQEFYSRNEKLVRFRMVCTLCGRTFDGSRHQKSRHDRNLGVYCSTTCRQTVNGKARSTKSKVQ